MYHSLFSLSRLKRKRHLFDEYYEEKPQLYTKKTLARLNCLLDYGLKKAKYRDKRIIGTSKLNYSHHSPFANTTCMNGGAEDLSGTKNVLDQISSWTNTQYSVNKVLSHVEFGHAIDIVYLKDSINKKFLEFHRDITEECGVEDKQHSWAVIEKREEVLMYGPYYPDYNNGVHSEDLIIKQTQELLASKGVSDDWNVYVFTLNSPCLARNTDPCMLNLVQMAYEWYSLYGVKTHIGYVKCWGFKGTKENLFRDISFRHLHCVDLSNDHESYVKLTQKITDTTQDYVLSESLYSAVKQFFSSRQVNLKFNLISAMQEQDRKDYFNNMYTVLECNSQDKREIFTQEIDTMIEVVQAQLLGENACLEEYLEKGQIFALDYGFSSQICDTVHNQLRLTFHQCWRDMVQSKYAEFIREQLTDIFNWCTLKLFNKDIARFTQEYVQIGRIRGADCKGNGRIVPVPLMTEKNL